MPETLDSTEIPPSSDGTRRFLFEDADIRGEIVHLDSAYREIIAIHQYPLAVSRLLGEFLAAAVLLHQSQVRGDIDFAGAIRRRDTAADGRMRPPLARARYCPGSGPGYFR